MKFIQVTCFVLMIFLSSIAHAQLSINQLPSGEYDESSSLAINTEEKNISGYITAYRGDINNPELSSFECEFYFSGKIQSNGPTKIVVNGSKEKKSTTGTIALDPDKNAALLITLDEGLKECALMGNHYELVNISKKKNWIEMRLVSAKRSYFHGSVESKDHRKAYVVCGDLVAITAKDKDSGRVKVEYGNTKGWLLEKDLLGIGEALKCR